jgi:hypothetical protein
MRRQPLEDLYLGRPGEQSLVDTDGVVIICETSGIGVRTPDDVVDIDHEDAVRSRGVKQAAQTGHHRACAWNLDLRPALNEVILHIHNERRGVCRDDLQGPSSVRVVLPASLFLAHSAAALPERVGAHSVLL